MSNDSFILMIAVKFHFWQLRTLALKNDYCNNQGTNTEDLEGTGVMREEEVNR